MAKKKKADDSALDGVFAKLISEQNRAVPGSATTGTEMFSTVRMWIPTSSVIMDTILSNKETGGWPVGRTIELYGEESIGKSTLTFAAMAQTQQMGGLAIYYDVEQAGSQEMMKANGVDLSRLIISNCTSVEEIFSTLETTLTTIINTKELKGKPIFVCMDSLAQMTTDAEIDSDYEHNMNIDLKKAKQMGKCLRKITPFLNKANACLIIINQLRDKPGVTYGDPTTTPGGKALKFAASQRIKLMGKSPVKIMDPTVEKEYKRLITEWEEECEGWKVAGGSKGTGYPKPPKPKRPKGDEVIVGYDIIAKTIKNKVAPPDREAEFRIIFTQGIVEEPAWLDYGLKYGIVETAGNSYTFQLKDFPAVGTFGRNDWLDIVSDVEIHEYMGNKIQGFLVKPMDSLKGLSTDSDNDEPEFKIKNSPSPDAIKAISTVAETDIESPEEEAEEEVTEE